MFSPFILFQSGSSPIKQKKVPHSHFRHTVTLHYKHKQLMPGKAPAFPLHVRDFSKSQNMIPRRGTHKKELYQYSSTGYRCCQFVLYYIWYVIMTLLSYFVAFVSSSQTNVICLDINSSQLVRVFPCFFSSSLAF